MAKLAIPMRNIPADKRKTYTTSVHIGEEIFTRMQSHREVNWSKFLRDQIVSALDQLDAQKAKQ